MRRSAAAFGAAALIVFAVAGTAGALEEVDRKKGKSVRGETQRTATAVRVNTFGCKVEAMTYGVVEIPLAEVESVLVVETRDGLYERLDALAPGDVKGREGLLGMARRLRLRPEERRIAEEILRIAPTNEAGLKVVGGKAGWDERRRGNPFLDRALGTALRRLVRLPHGGERREAAKRLAEQTGYDARAEVIERMARSHGEARGIRHEVALVYGAERHPGATYSICVPDDYDPAEPRPLVLALHGGGIARAEGTQVIGTARDAFDLFVKGARARGWFLVCPTAVEAPWPVPANKVLLDDVLAEIALRFNVDLERVHVVGQGGGANGAWWFASKHRDRFASVGAASAVADNVVSVLASRKVGLWIYHGEDDAVVPVAPIRKLAEKLRRQDTEFVYCELPGQGHGLPFVAEADLYRMLSPRRRRKAKPAWPRSSFEQNVSKAEIAYLGDPRGGWGATVEDEDDLDLLWGLLAGGRADAEHAARRLRVLGPPDLVARSSAFLARRDLTAVARGWAAWLIGEAGGPEADIGPLADAVRAEEDTFLRGQAARALGRIGSEDALQDLLWALQDIATVFSQPGENPRRVPFWTYDSTCRLVADIVETLGRVGKTASVAAEIEAHAVVRILLDGRAVDHRAATGEDPVAAKARLAEACARAYRALGAERTLFDLLQKRLRREPRVIQAVRRGMREGLRR